LPCQVIRVKSHVFFLCHFGELNQKSQYESAIGQSSPKSASAAYDSSVSTGEVDADCDPSSEIRNATEYRTNSHAWRVQSQNQPPPLWKNW
jgi:hypothetical protein